MATIRYRGRLLDARPDRIDFRDRPFRPRLVSLNPQFPSDKEIQKYLPEYRRAKLVLDQGDEGACTGFGLAAVINYLLWRRKATGMKIVSMRMLYHLARMYDEWEGEDYDGSSCRGAMKGWHRHGVTTDQMWPYRNSRGEAEFIKPKQGWEENAASRPLGAYYRIDKNSVADMQAAIFEVGAIYCSADVHDGWFINKSNTLPIIKPKKMAGGHAFAFVGYNQDGFIVQNSWGPNWGWNGFAVLPYEDWVRNGADAWAAVLGAPTRTAAPRARSTMPLNDERATRATWFWSENRDSERFKYKNKKVMPLGEEEALGHTIVLGNNGRPLSRLLDAQDAIAGMEEVCFEQPLKWLTRRNSSVVPRIAIYAHGGLNNEEASLRRVSVMAPYFRENDIYPLFITWKTGFGESLKGMIADSVESFFGKDEVPARGWLEDAANQVAEARDRAIEVSCESLLIKPIWSQMKQNAEAAAADTAGLGLLASHLAQLQTRIKDLEIHLVGHSAGAILHGHLLEQLAQNHLGVASLSLYAPACTIEFANQYFANAVARQALARKTIHLDVMTDERERADAVGPYGKSLLYLVSRALENLHKTPLLGLQAALDRKAEGKDQWHDECQKSVDAWRTFAGTVVKVRAHGVARAKVSTGRDMIPLCHGSFDNDVMVVADTLKRIRGKKSLTAEVENLRDI